MNTPLLGASIFMLVAVLSTLICYGVTRILLLSRMGEDSEMLAGKIFARLGALHALILALMLTQEMADYRDISRIVTKEASAISDVYNGLQEYDKVNQQSTAAIYNLIVDYVKTAMVADRTALVDSRLSNQTLINYRRIYRQLGNLQPTNNDQEYLRAEMLKSWDIVSEFHMRLRSIVEYEVPSFYWIVIITGLFAVVIPFSAYSPKIANLVMLSTYAAYNGVVMYVIFSIANPFTGPLAVDYRIFENLLAMMANTAL